MRRQAIVMTAVLAAALLAGCSDSKGDNNATATTLPASSAAVAVSPQAIELELRLLTIVPDGFKQQDDSVGDTGPSDLRKAIRDDGGTDAETVLTQDGFVAGYQRYWTKDGGAIAVFLYEFSNATGATHYLQRLRASATKADATTTVAPFAVSRVPGSDGYATHSGTGDAATVTFTRGNYVTKITLTGVDATPAVANTLATEQYSNLG